MWIRKRSGKSFANGVLAVEATMGNNPVTNKPVYIFKVAGKKYTIECVLCYVTT